MAEEATAVNEEPAVAPAESAPVEEKTVTAENAFDDDTFDDIDDEVAKSGEADGEDEDGEADKPETENQETEEQKPEQPQDEKPLAEKSQNRFQKLANENRELKEQIERLKSQESQVAAEQGLLNEINPETGDYFTPAEAERIARQQSLEQAQQSAAQQRYALEVRQNQESIGRESRQALDDFPILNEQSKEFNPQIAAEFDKLVGENIIYELQDGSRYPASVLAANGYDLNQATLIGSNFSPYQLAKLIADSTKANASVYQAQAQRSAEQMLANADTTGGNTQAGAKDADIDDFDKAWDE